MLEELPGSSSRSGQAGYVGSGGVKDKKKGTNRTYYCELNVVRAMAGKVRFRRGEGVKRKATQCVWVIVVFIFHYIAKG